MNKIIETFIIAVVCMACIAMMSTISMTPRDVKGNPRPSSQIEEVVYMSDIDGLVKAIMLYGVTNGITYNGTNYMFVVEPKE